MTPTRKIHVDGGPSTILLFPLTANKIFLILSLCSNCWTPIRAESPFYRQRVEHGATFVDKSLLVEDYFRSCNDICRVLRPKGWGKTTNLDMLKRFLEIETDPSNGKRLTFEERVNGKLFAGGQVELKNGHSKRLAALKIAARPDIVKLQGRQPTIYVSFENITGVDYEEVESRMKDLIATVFDEHAYLKPVSNESATDLFERYRRADSIGNGEMLVNGLRFLSDLLRKYFESPVHLLADDYDVPIRSVFLAVYRDYESKFGLNMTDKEICAKVDDSVRLRKVISLVENVLGRCLQNTATIAYGMITGVLDVHLRAVSERSVYDVRCSLVDRALFDHYGFSEHEVGELLTQAGLAGCERRQEVDRWYRYVFSGKSTYSPWSIDRYLRSNGKAENYFVTRPENHSLSNLVFMTDDLQPKFRNLMVNRAFSCDHSTRIFFDRFIDEYKVLLFEGYLNADSREYLVEDISIPNSEIRQIFENKSASWLHRRLGISNEYFASTADRLIELDIEEFRKKFIAIVSNVPALDQNNNSEMEKVYYDGIVTCLFRNLTVSGKYAVVWNEQKRFFGKINVLLVPKEPTGIDAARNNAVFLDYNTADSANDANLQLDVAWKLINQKLRSVNLSLEPYNKASKFLKLLLIFYGNKFDIRHEIVN